MEKETLTKIRKAGALREHKNNIYIYIYIIQEKNSTENIQNSVYIKWFVYIKWCSSLLLVEEEKQ